MNITVDDYAYVYVKLAVLKRLIMTSDDLKKISSLADFESLQTFITRFFPGFSPTESSIEGFESAIWQIYFKILEKILSSSPLAIQTFLKQYLFRFEIWNLKVTLVNILAEVDESIMQNPYYERPAIILHRKSLLNALKKAKTLEDLEKVTKKTPYEKVIHDGIAKYDNTKELFYLEQALDKFYYNNLLNSLELYPPEEREFIKSYIQFQIDYYNLNLMFRSLYNQIDLEKYQDYLIPQGYYFKFAEIQRLSTATTQAEFFDRLFYILRKEQNFLKMLIPLKNVDLDAWGDLSHIFLNQFLSKFQSEIMPAISKSSIARIFNIMVKKELEIDALLGRAVQITLAHEKV